MATTTDHRDHSDPDTSYEEIFEHFVHFDSCDLSDSFADQNITDEWDRYFGVRDPLASPTQRLRTPSPSRSRWGKSVDSDFELFGEIDNERSRSPLGQICSLPVRESRPISYDRDLVHDISKACPTGISKSAPGSRNSMTMEQHSSSRRRMQTAWTSKMESHGRQLDCANSMNAAIASPPSSAPLQPTVWSDLSIYPHPSANYKRAQSYSYSTAPFSSIPAQVHYSPWTSPPLDDQAASSAENYFDEPSINVCSDASIPPMSEWDCFQTETNFSPDLEFQSLSFIDVPSQNWTPCTAATFPDTHLVSYDSSFFVGRPPSPPRSDRQSRPYLGSQTQHASPMLDQQAFNSRRDSTRSTSHTSIVGSQPPTPPATPRSRKASRMSANVPKHHRRSKTVSGSIPCSTSVGFVNFTPEDSRKILTGVAPSGSSKTKARREREAEERRKRLSMAAAKAVIDAGGNVEELRQCGLLA